MDRLLNRAFGRGLLGVHQDVLWKPAIESCIKDGKFLLRAELPGVNQKDLDLTINDRELIIKGER